MPSDLAHRPLTGKARRGIGRLQVASIGTGTLAQLLVGGIGLFLLMRWALPSQTSPHKLLERIPSLRLVSASDSLLDVRQYPFLQSRIGRDERPDLFDEHIANGIADYWLRFQKPFITSPETDHLDEEVVRGAIDDLLAYNGWVAASCPTLTRPFNANAVRDDQYEDLKSDGQLYYVALIMHSADHFIVDQLAIIVQLARKLGTRHIFVSIVDYASHDATSTLLDLTEAVLTLLGVAFRIRHVDAMTADVQAAYYPLEEAYTRNLALEPLLELREKKRTEFSKVIWIKGFTCPQDVLESLRVSAVNEAAMVCGMDWVEHNKLFLFSDAWRARDMDGRRFRQSPSTADAAASPPLEEIASQRYGQHLPFQVFCCESGTHIVDPARTYYRGILYRSATNPLNLTIAGSKDPRDEPDRPCFDSAQAWMCRDLWIDAARRGKSEEEERRKKAEEAMAKLPKEHGWFPLPANPMGMGGASAGVEEDNDDVAIRGREDDDVGDDQHEHLKLHHAANRKGRPDRAAATDSTWHDQPQNVLAHDHTHDHTPPSSSQHQPPSLDGDKGEVRYEPARIMVNPRMVTTYAGVSHTQLAFDLFGKDDDEALKELVEASKARKKMGGVRGALGGGGGGWQQAKGFHRFGKRQHPGEAGSNDADDKAAGQLHRDDENAHTDVGGSAHGHAKLLSDEGSSEGGAGSSSSAGRKLGGKYVLDEWRSAPEGYVCTEMYSTGGRKAPVSQRRVGFPLRQLVEEGHL